MTFSAKTWPSFDSYGHLYVKKLPKSFSPWISTSNMTQNGQNWVYFGPFRPKIEPKIVSYNDFGNCLHEDGHRNQMMAVSWLKTSFLGSENQLFNTFQFFIFSNKKIWVVA